MTEYASGDEIYHEGDHDEAVWLVLSGRVRLDKGGHVITYVDLGKHFGEFPVFDPSLVLTVSAVADSSYSTWVAKIPESDFARIAADHPILWRRLGKTLVQRLDSTNAQRMPVNDPPILFIGSAGEAVSSVARPLAAQFDSQRDGIKVELWTEGVFGPSRVNIEALEGIAGRADFAALVANPVDLAEQKKENHRVPRDNLVFEAGLFMGSLGRERTCIIIPRYDRPKLPTDLLGLTPIEYALTADGEPELLPVAETIRELVRG